MKKPPFTDEEVLRATEAFETPFYLYNAGLIRERVRAVQAAFAWNSGFREYFAVKALPTPAVLALLRNEGCGVDCASLTELMLAQRTGFDGTDIMFTSNNTPVEEYQLARELGAIINLDSLEMVDFLATTAGIPETVCVRYAPAGETGSENAIIGEAREAKFGMTYDQVFTALGKLRDLGAKRFGVHCMAASNSLDPDYYPSLARMLFELTLEVKQQLGIELSFLNFAGGLGIPYMPDQTPLDINAVGSGVQKVYAELLEPNGLSPAIFTELGRYVTGPAGALITSVTHLKSTYKDYVGVDSSAVDLLRPAMYGAYHHVSVVGKSDRPGERVYDIVGSLCENNDKFAIDRELPTVDVGDVLLIHDAGAHSRSMGFNYNGKLRCGEVLLEEDGSLRLIRRRETVADYFATLEGVGD